MKQMTQDYIQEFRKSRQGFFLSQPWDRVEKS
mgnify:CR=1 FL=1